MYSVFRKAFDIFLAIMTKYILKKKFLTENRQIIDNLTNNISERHEFFIAFTKAIFEDLKAFLLKKLLITKLQPMLNWLEHEMCPQYCNKPYNIYVYLSTAILIPDLDVRILNLIPFDRGLLLRISGTRLLFSKRYMVKRIELDKQEINKMKLSKLKALNTLFRTQPLTYRFMQYSYQESDQKRKGFSHLYWYVLFLVSNNNFYQIRNKSVSERRWDVYEF